MNAVGRVAATGVLALIGLVVVQFIFGLIGITLKLTFFLLFKVLPIVLIVALVVWLVKRAKRTG